MPEFISKLQHKNYEKGEFSDEKARSLDETIELINNFPWDRERTLTDVQLTGPSVTIRDEYGNNLKLGLYFGGKFCLYYLDCDNHLYEYHAAELKDACDIVTDFFSGQIALDKFDKHFLSIGSKSHFENASFDHTINSFAFFGRLFFYFLLFSMLTCCAISIMIVESPLTAKLILLPFSSFMCLLLLYSVYLMVRYYVRSKDMYLNISHGSDVFQFGDNYDEVKNYNKDDISNINIYSRFSSKGTPLLDIMEVNFSDGSEIEFPGLLIDPFDFRSKFTDTKITRFDKPRDIRKRMWDFANGK